MDLRVNNSPNFNATLRTSPTLQFIGANKQSLKNVKELFSEMTKEKKGTLGAFVDFENQNNLDTDRLVLRLGKGTVSKHVYRPQSAYPSKEWTNDFVKKNDIEKANILTKVFETLQLIPEKVDMKKFVKDENRNDTYNKVVNHLGDDKFNLAHMFEHLKVNNKDF